MKEISELRKKIYAYHRKYYLYIFDEWKWYSYRKFKAKLYMDISAYLVFIFMKMGVKPNTVTATYAIMGILGGVLLAIPSRITILSGIAFFYFRPFLDWSDGLLARETKQISITGDVLDAYGAGLGWIALWIGIGLYVANKSGMALFYYTVPLFPAIYAMNITSAARMHFYIHYLNKQTYLNIKQNQNRLLIKTNGENYAKFTRIMKARNFIDKIFEHNARSVDFICLIILIEVLFPTIFISWFIYLFFLLWQVVTFFAKFFVFVKSRWAEKELQRKLKEVYKG